MARRNAAAVVAAVVVLNLAAWGVFVLAVLPDDEAYRSLGLGIGVAVTAWTLGVRHAFDADHIAAIDIASRKLLADGRPAGGTGLFFALGHASVVMLVAIGITLSGREVLDAVSGAGSTTGLVAALFASVFLLGTAALNVAVLAGIVGGVRALRRGEVDERDLAARVPGRGPMLRAVNRLLGSVRRSRHMFAVGFAFGISFDTATEVLLFAGTAGAVGQGLPWVAVLSLPLLFAAGLALVDALNGLFVGAAYRWAFARPARKVFYNFTVTGLSVAVAALVGGVQAIAVASEYLHVGGPIGDAASALDLEILGYGVVGLFALVWVGAVAVWRFGHVEARWEAAVDRAVNLPGRSGVRVAGTRVAPHGPS